MNDQPEDDEDPFFDDGTHPDDEPESPLFGGHSGETDVPWTGTDRVHGFGRERSSPSLRDGYRTLGFDALDRAFGGVPDGGLVVLLAHPNTDTLTFALQFLNGGLQADESCALATLLSSTSRVLDRADDYGWPLRDAYEDGRLSVCGEDWQEASNVTLSLSEDLTSRATTARDRLAVDAFDLYESQFETDAARVRSVADLLETLHEDITTFLVVEQSPEYRGRSGFGLVERAADLVLRADVRSDGGLFRTIEAPKLGRPGELFGPKPYEISSAGVEIYEQSSVF